MKKVLILGYVWPEPDSSAAGRRMLQLIEFFLAQQSDITFASAANLSEHRIDLTELHVKEQAVALNCSSFDTFVAELQPDIVIFDRFFTEEQFGWRVQNAWPNAMRILNTEDLHSLRSARQTLLKQWQKKQINECDKYQLTPVIADQKKLFEVMADSDIAQREIAAIFRSDLTLMISEFEMQLLQDVFSVPAHLLFYCPFLLTPQSEEQPDFCERQHFISIGNFRHEPNWDAVLCLKHTLWPAIRQQLPDAQLNIYGAYPPPKATALHNPKQGFYVMGWAADAQAAMHGAKICLAPLRFGAGLKGKLVEAMLCGTPSVTTSIGAEAMHGSHSWPGVIADDAQDFIVAAVALYQQPEQWQAARQKANIILNDRYSVADFSALLLLALNNVMSDLSGHRRKNFIGTMLQHHLYKSAQYMSLWIEAKTKNAMPPS